MLRFLNYINFKWNQMIFWIHDLTARWGIGHTSVWFYDNLTWTLPSKWRLVGGKTDEVYRLEHELYIAQHQASYYANLAYEYQWTIIDALYSEDESELAAEEISSEKLDTNSENVGTTN